MKNGMQFVYVVTGKKYPRTETCVFSSLHVARDYVIYNSPNKVTNKGNEDYWIVKTKIDGHKVAIPGLTPYLVYTDRKSNYTVTKAAYNMINRLHETGPQMYCGYGFRPYQQIVQGSIAWADTQFDVFEYGVLASSPNDAIKKVKREIKGKY